MRSLREITIDELRRELPISEWLKWARETLAEQEATDEGKQYMRFNRSNKDAAKPFREELVPETLRFAGTPICKARSSRDLPVDDGPADTLNS